MTTRTLDPQAFQAMTASVGKGIAGAKRIFLLAGLAMLVGGCVWGWRSYVASTTWSRTPGTVLRVEVRGSGDDRRVTAFVGYVDADGVEREMSPSVQSSSRNFQAGSKVTVLYEPSTGKAVLDDVTDLWVFPAVLTLFGIVFSLVGSLARFDIPSQGTTSPPRPKDPLGRVEHDEPSTPLIR